MQPNILKNLKYNISIKPVALLMFSLIISLGVSAQGDNTAILNPDSIQRTLQDSILKAKAKADSVMLQQTDSVVKAFFRNLKTDYATTLSRGISSYKLDTARRALSLNLREGSAGQVYTPRKVSDIYSGLKTALPSPVNDYHIDVLAFNHEISTLIPNAYRLNVDKDTARLWQPITNTGNPWVRNASRPYTASKGLEGAHLTVWPSHGRYYDHQRGDWRWQRPRLYCTTEDLFTRSIVVPFLIPMLERAGAVVYCPRERDEQTQELIIDNDSLWTETLTSVTYTTDSTGAEVADTVLTTLTHHLAEENLLGGLYQEIEGTQHFETCDTRGFAHLRNIYTDQNPFQEGTARRVRTVNDPKYTSTFIWRPNISRDGQYAVYVSYPRDSSAVSDARYIVRHGGVNTEVRVNQQMGWGTWVYLGTYFFTVNNPKENIILLSNLSEERGYVCADAVRLGGGMGNIARGPRNGAERDFGVSVRGGEVSGFPRYLEGSRYWAQWAGMPRYIFDTKDGRNDYADDINARSNALNYLAGGSPYEQGVDGLAVPMELSLALHSDAGWTKDDNATIGTLAISTLKGDAEDELFLNGKSRLWNYDLASVVQDQVVSDLSASLNKQWNRREIYNRNYSESRKPEVPSIILETLSHQNFRDMLLGHDPNFKFLLARSVYKAVARFVANAHGRECVIQPLPVKDLAVCADGDSARLSWAATPDSLEPSAVPSAYIIYTAREGEAFDNGLLIRGKTTAALPIERDRLYRFRVSALNAGGESFPSETLAALSASREKRRILIVNGFTRLSSPAVVNTADSLGFDIKKDIGVPYISTSEYCGRQTGFLRSNAGKETANGLGYSNAELEGRSIAGNNFNYPYLHALSLKDNLNTNSISSCSRTAFVTGNVADKPDLVDLILGLQKDDGEQSIVGYKSFDAPLCKAIEEYLDMGCKLIVSGAYIGCDMQGEKERRFTANTLGYTFLTAQNASDEFLLEDSTLVTGADLRMGDLNFSLLSDWNSQAYAATSVDTLLPSGNAKPLIYYSNNRVAAVYKKNIAALGFPIEAIRQPDARREVMQRLLRVLE